MPSKNKNEEIPPGFTLRRFLKGHGDVINRIAWSHNGMFIASPSHDGTIRIWNAQTGQELRTLKGHKGNVNSIAWSPESRVLASVSSSEEAVLLWDVPTGKALDPLEGHSWGVYSIAWSPDGNILASGSLDQTVRLWDAKTGQLLRTFSELSGTVINLEWSPNGNILAVGSDVQAVRLWNVQTDKVLPIPIGAYDVYTIAWSPDGTMLATDYGYDTIQLWNVNTRQRVHILEGHTAPVRCVAFSFDGRLLASKSADWTVRIWRTDTWEPVAVLQEPASNFAFTGLAFHPKDPVLATLGDYDKVIRIWDLDMAVLLGIQPRAQAVHYSNAKVVLVGDSGVGKSGLGLALTGQSFVPTESTHGRHIWTLNSWEIDCGEYKETRETLLWDLAGQPGYRLIHQLHLSEVAVALIVFDSHSESDPFAGVNHWVRALRLSELSQENSVKSMKKFLVAARVDRGGTSASRQRINMLMQQLGLDGYFETSAKEGWNISALAEAISQAIDWQILTKTTSTELFQRIKTFLVAEKTAGRLLSTYNDLCRTFQTSQDKQVESENIVGEFKTCIGQLESQGLIRQLSFGNLVLLQPELLDAYASALINAVRDEPDGLGSISEAMIWAGKFAVPSDERIKDREKEKLLLIAMVEDLLRYEIALREESEDGAYLVFPSQSTRENPDLPDPEGKAVIFGFEGPVLNIYATLAVRLSHSGLFKKKELWKNAVTYTTDAGGMYGIFLHNMGEGRAELTLFFDKVTSEESCFHFEEYVRIHLQRRALTETIQRRRIFTCPECGVLFTDAQVKYRIQRGFDWIRCSVCDTSVLLLDREKRLAKIHISLISEMDRAADSMIAREAAKSTMLGKIATHDFDVFLCHNGKDSSEVKKIAIQLKEHGILPWLDEWELPRGQSLQSSLAKQIAQIKSAVVFVGKDGLGPWQKTELDASLREFVKRECPVIPVLLASAPNKPRLPLFLEGITWVDFSKKEPDPLRQLIWGITGKHIQDQ